MGIRESRALLTEAIFNTEKHLGYIPADCVGAISRIWADDDLASMFAVACGLDYSVAEGSYEALRRVLKEIADSQNLMAGEG